MNSDEFGNCFTTLTGNRPFPWQESLFREFTSGSFPSSCNLPTGLGKTSVIPIWLLALAASSAGSIPRRLVYVVNRRTVVDQATEEAKKSRERLAELPTIANQLRERCVDRAGPSLAISTLRGQFADNREWSVDPARPAVIVGTVDMIGSRLLFEGYGCGFKTRPLHAGFLGQDVLLVHDEAHLEPAFQRLLEAIRDEQHARERTENLPWPKLRVMALTATPRGDEEPFELTEAERTPPAEVPDPPSLPIHHVWRRLQARKGISFITVPRAEVTATIADRALRHKEQGKAILVFVRTIDDVNAVRSALARKGSGVTEGQVVVLTGTLRGLERDRLATHDPVFARFLADPKVELRDDQKQRTVYLVCTSAGEVGVDISADHMVSDLTPLDSMAQRFGRVNRRGGGKAEIDVVCENEPDPKRKEDAFEQARQATLPFLQSLPPCDWIADRVEASPLQIGRLVRGLTDEQRVAAFTPAPDILPVGDILFDAWAMTTLRGRLPARPPVEDWLHGVSDRDPPETHVAWREEVELLSPKYKVREDENQAHTREKWEVACERLEPALTELFGEFPLKPHEQLRDRTSRVHETLAVLAQTHEGKMVPVWVLEPDDTVRITTLADLTEKDKKGFVVPLGGRTVVLPPTAGGLSADGTLDGSAAFDRPEAIIYDVAGLPPQSTLPTFVRLVATQAADGKRYTLVGRTHEPPTDFEILVEDAEDEPEVNRILRDEFAQTKIGPVCVALRLDAGSSADDGEQDKEYVIVKPFVSRALQGASSWPSLDRHLAGVKDAAESICAQLFPLSEWGQLGNAIVFAAACHDLGKNRGAWQRGAGNRPDSRPVAKTLHGRPPENLNGFRHEFASLIDVQSYPELVAEFETFSPDMQDLILHLIATHHGRGRPHFPGRGDADLSPRQTTKKRRRRPPRPENIDPERPEAASVAVAAEVPARFARLQWRYGRWALAYLESLVRASDALDSRRIEETPVGNREPGIWPRKSPPTPPHAWRPRGMRPKATIRVGMEPTNPGQFFACCGLLELAHRLWHGAEGWFEGTEFCVATKGSLADLIQRFASCQISSSLPDPELKRLGTLLSANKSKLSVEDLAEKERLHRAWQIERLHIGDPFDFWVDWWHDTHGERTELKTWASKQFVLPMARAMQLGMRNEKWWEKTGADCLSATIPADTLPFNFDSALSTQAAAIDVGFSLDKLGFKLPFRPVIELSAFIGLQRVRPIPGSADGLFRYGLWSSPLLPAGVTVMATGAADVPGIRHYEFRLLDRSQYAKTFLPAQPYRGDAR